MSASRELSWCQWTHGHPPSASNLLIMLNIWCDTKEFIVNLRALVVAGVGKLWASHSWVTWRCNQFCCFTGLSRLVDLRLEHMTEVEINDAFQLILGQLQNLELIGLDTIEKVRLVIKTGCCVGIYFHSRQSYRLRCLLKLGGSLRLYWVAVQFGSPSSTYIPDECLHSFRQHADYQRMH